MSAPPYVRVDEEVQSPPLRGSTPRRNWPAPDKLAPPPANGAHDRHSSSSSALEEHTFELADKSSTNAYGRVEFEKPRIRPPARYIRLSHETPIQRVTQLVVAKWMVKEPQVLISITGAAQGFRMQPHVHDVVNQGIVKAAKKTDAWLVTGGTDTGVMKLVGEAVRKADVDVPVIGVTPWLAVYGREQLERDTQPSSPGSVSTEADDMVRRESEAEDGGRVRFYRRTKPDDHMGVALQPNHTHFLLVDTPDAPGKSPFGTEIPFRMLFERQVRDEKSVPTVVVVLNGGVGSLQIVLQAVKDETPVVLINDSGGIALTLAHYLQSATGEVLFDRTGSGNSYIKPQGVIDDQTGKIDEAKLEAWRKGIEVQLEEIKELNATRKCIHTFAVRNAASGAVANLDNALLRAIVFDSEEHIARRWTSGANVLHGYRKVLRLAIEWGEREIVQTLMMNPPGAHNDFYGVATKVIARQKRQALEGGVHLEDGPSELSILLADALLLALKTKHASIVDLLLERDARPEHLDIMELWRDARVTKIHHFNFHADFQPATQRRTDPTVRVRKPSVMQELVRRTSLGGLGDGGGSEASRQAVLSASAEIYYGKVVPLIQKQCRLPHSLTLWANQALHGAGGARELDAYRWSAKDLFFWAVFNPQEEDKDLVHTLWRYTEQPIREALVASHMAAQLAALSRRGPEEYEARAKLYEGWAIGVLDQCTEAEARLVLQAQFAESASVSNGTPVHLAVRLSRKAFLAHANTQSLLDAWWRGDSHEVATSTAIPVGPRWYLARQPVATWWRILVHALCFTNTPFVRMECPLSEEAAKGDAPTGETLALSSAARDAHERIMLPVPWAAPLARSMRWAQLDDFYRAPFTKFVLRMVCFFAFLVQYALVLMEDDGTPDLSYIELTFFAWAIGHAIDELHQLTEAWQRDQPHFSDEWAAIDALMFWLLFPVTLALRVVALFVCASEPAQSIDLSADGTSLAGGDMCWQIEWARIVLAVTAILCFFRFLANYRVDKELGQLIYMIRAMLNDISRFVQILIVVMCGFAFAFGGLAPPRLIKLHLDANSPFALPIWNLFDMSEVEEVASTGADGLRHANSALSLGVLAIYLFVAQIMLAMMNASYNDQKQHTNEQWAASRAAMIEELQLNFPVPPPFSAPYLLVALFGRAWLCTQRCRCDGGRAGGRKAYGRTATNASLLSSSGAHSAATQERHEARRAQARGMRAFIDAEEEKRDNSTQARVALSLSKTEQIASMLEAAEVERGIDRQLLHEQRVALDDLRAQLASRQQPAKTAKAPGAPAAQAASTSAARAAAPAECQSLPGTSATPGRPARSRALAPVASTGAAAPQQRVRRPSAGSVGAPCTPSANVALERGADVRQEVGVCLERSPTASDELHQRSPRVFDLDLADLGGVASPPVRPRPFSPSATASSCATSAQLEQSPSNVGRDGSARRRFARAPSAGRAVRAAESQYASNYAGCAAEAHQPAAPAPPREDVSLPPPSARDYARNEPSKREPQSGVRRPGSAVREASGAPPGGLPSGVRSSASDRPRSPTFGRGDGVQAFRGASWHHISPAS